MKTYNVEYQGTWTTAGGQTVQLEIIAEVEADDESDALDFVTEATEEVLASHKNLSITQVND